METASATLDIMVQVAISTAGVYQEMAHQTVMITAFVLMASVSVTLNGKEMHARRAKSKQNQKHVSFVMA
jgi:uncharacterized membrane protein